MEVGAISGGSYNYLCFVDADEIGQRLGDLDGMAAALEEICPEAAAATRDLADHVRAAQPKIDALKDLWHAVEWWHSSDWGRERAEEVAARYRTVHVATDGGGES